MATRRARIKVAPNLGAAAANRNRKTDPTGIPEQKSAITTSPTTSATGKSSSNSSITFTERRPVTPTTASRLNNNLSAREDLDPSKSAALPIGSVDIDSPKQADAAIASVRRDASPLPSNSSPVNPSCSRMNLSPPPSAEIFQLGTSARSPLVMEHTSKYDIHSTILSEFSAISELPVTLEVSTSGSLDVGGKEGAHFESVKTNMGSLSPSATTSTRSPGIAVGGSVVSPSIRRHFGLKAKFKPNVAAAAAERHRHLVADIPQRSRKISTSDGGGRAAAASPRLRTTSGSSSGGGDNHNILGSPQPVAARLRSISGSEDEDSCNTVPASVALRLPPSVQRSSVACANGGLPATPLMDDYTISREGNKEKTGGTETITDLRGQKQPLSPLPVFARRSRRLTETSSVAPNSPRHRYLSTGGCGGVVNPGLIRRKAEHRRRFKGGVPERKAMTVFDLIYYNPENGQKMASSISSTEQQQGEGEEIIVGEKETVVDEQAVDNPEEMPPATKLQLKPTTPPPPEYEEEDDEGDAMPVPQVKVGANGEIILDEASTLVESTATKRARADLSNTPIVIETAANGRPTNYGTWSKRRARSEWSDAETLRFYRALAITGSDFSMMASLFKKRSREELKVKFKKEERANPTLIDKCLRSLGGGQFTDLQDFPPEESEEDEESQDKEKEDGKKARGRRRSTTRKRKTPAGGARTRRRGNYVNRGYYDSSSGGEEGDVSETSKSPARKRPAPAHPSCQPNTRRERRVSSASSTVSQPPLASPRATIQSPVLIRHQLPPSPTAAAIVTGATVAPQAAAVNTAQLQRLPGGVQFPPALLAANPSLLGAQPGSLVVVASPSKTDPSSQLLHVYMVKNRRPALGPSPLATAATPPPLSPSPLGSPLSADPERTRIDPAVMRAFDRNRQSLERQLQQDKLLEAAGMRARTYSEGALYRRSRTVSEGGNHLFPPGRIRTLSGSTQDLPTSLGGGSSSPSALAGANKHTVTANLTNAAATPVVNSDSFLEANSNNGLPIAIKSKPVPSQ